MILDVTRTSVRVTSNTMFLPAILQSEKKIYELERLHGTHHLQLPHDAGAVSDEGGDPLAHLLQLVLAEVARSPTTTAQL